MHIHPGEDQYGEKVILIGDSIRMGYQEVVRQQLSGIAEVWTPKENGGNSQNVLKYLDIWVLAKNVSVIHINCGLHDLKKDFASGKLAIPINQYEINVREIMRQLLKKTKASVIWALTTPVNEKWHHEKKDFDRFETDVCTYNEAATNIATQLGIPTDDLYSLIVKAGRDKYLLPDGVHYTSEGYSLLGKAVAEFIKPYLKHA